MAAPPVESLEKIGVHDHVAFLCRNTRERVDVVAHFLRLGLARGEKIMLCCTRPRGDEILRAIGGGGIDIGSALARGAIVSARIGRSAGVPLEDAAIASLRAAARLARAEKYSALRICMDIPSVLGKDAGRDLIDAFQARLHDLVSAHNVLCLCVHEVDELPADVLVDALRTHPQIIHDGKLLDNFFFVSPADDPEKMTPRRKLEERLAHLAERNDRIARVRRQAIRLKRFGDVTASLLAHERMADILNDIAVGVISLGYRMCWIGTAEPDGSVVPAAEWGDKWGFLREIAVRWDESPLGQGPVGRAIREGRPSVVRDVLRSRRFGPWRDSALARGFRSVAGIPLGAGTPAAGALAVYAAGKDAFDREAVDELAAYAQQASLVLARARELRAVAESEERFRSVVENTGVFVIELDADGKVILFNRAAERITGYAAAEVLGREGFPLFLPERERERVIAAYRDILKDGAAEEFACDIRTRDGAERSLAWNAKAITGPGGELLAVVGMGVDITDRLRVEKEKDVLRSQLAQAGKMEAVGALAGGIAHDFNNILGTIIGYASLMQARMDPADPFADVARKIREQATRAEELTGKLLGFARRGKHRVEAVSLNDVAASVVAAVATTFDRSIEVRTRLDPSLPLVEGDAGQLEQSVLNLCLNARDAMPGGGTLTIETGSVRLTGGEALIHHVRGAGDYATIAVRDTGEGITEEGRRHIFEPFYTTRQDIGRTGMGLPMVYGVVKNHEGGIDVESAPGRGSTFRIHLPVTTRDKSRKPALPGDPFPKGSGTILVVDDEPGIREMARELLSALGYDTLPAEDGQAACRTVAERGAGIALVLLDIVMPRMGGKETFEALRELSPSLPILLSSGYTLEGVAQEILDKGANGFIQKPYGLSELARAVRGVLDARAGN
ncbi:MAG: MEDS domain-containing protein [Deltaproteobacteria bacterium]